MSDIRFSQAAGAYGDALRAAESIIAKLSTGSGAPASDTKEAANSGFFDMVAKSLGDAAATGYKGEATTALGLSGKAGITDVVNAVNNAETALTTVVAIRDKVINAYQDIIKMQI